MRIQLLVCSVCSALLYAQIHINDFNIHIYKVVMALCLKYKASTSAKLDPEQKRLSKVVSLMYTEDVEFKLRV
jgi:hypothetical protein